MPLQAYSVENEERTLRQQGVVSDLYVIISDISKVDDKVTLTLQWYESKGHLNKSIYLEQETPTKTTTHEFKWIDPTPHYYMYLYTLPEFKNAYEVL